MSITMLIRPLFGLLAALCVVTLACGSESDDLRSADGGRVDPAVEGSSEQSDGAAGISTTLDASSGLQPDAATHDGSAADSGSSDGSTSASDGSTPVGWPAVASYVGAQRILPGSCRTAVSKRTPSINVCQHEDVATLSGSSPCSAIVNFATDPITGAIVATLHETATVPGSNLCMSDVVTVLPPVTDEIVIPLVLQSDGTARGVGSRASDTSYTLVVTPGQSLKLTGYGYTPSRAERQAIVAANGCVQTMHDSGCTFEVVTPN